MYRYIYNTSSLVHLHNIHILTARVIPVASSPSSYNTVASSIITLVHMRIKPFIWLSFNPYMGNTTYIVAIAESSRLYNLPTRHPRLLL